MTDAGAVGHRKSTKKMRWNSIKGVREIKPVFGTKPSTIGGEDIEAG